jgi:hypothetical protein
VASRRQPNLTELLGTALLQLFPNAMTFEEAKALTPKQIIARVRKTHDVHHWTYVAVLGGTNHPTNMSWMAADAHDKRTREIDVPAIAKMKRSAKKRDAQSGLANAPKPKPKQKIKSRGFPSREERARLKERYGRPSQ